MRTKHALGYALSLLVVSGLACGGSKQQAPATTTPAQVSTGTRAADGTLEFPPLPDAPQAAPTELFGMGVIADVQGQITAIADLANAVQPGTGAMLNPVMVKQALAGMLGAPELAGLDLSKPMYIVLLNPKTVESPVVLVAGVSDEAALKGLTKSNPDLAVRVHHGFVAVGEPKAVGVASPWALTNLVTQPTPAMPTFTLWVAPVMAAYGTDIEKNAGQVAELMRANPETASAAVIIDAYVTGLLAVAHDTDRVVFGFEATKDAGSFHLDVMPRAQSSLQAFAAAQKPSDHALLARLPGNGTVAVSGNFDWSPLRDFMIKVMKASVESTFGGWDEAMATTYQAWFDIMSGDMAMSFHMDGGFQAAATFGVKDGKKAAQLITVGQTLFKQLQKKLPAGVVTVKVRPGAVRYKGAVLDDLAITFGNKTLPATEKEKFEKLFGKNGLSLFMGVSGDHVVCAFGKNARKDAQAIIDGLQKKVAPALPAGLAETLEDSKKRSESMVMYMDLAALAQSVKAMESKATTAAKPTGSGAVFALAFRDQGLQFRVTAVPVAQIKAIQAQQ